MTACAKCLAWVEGPWSPWCDDCGKYLTPSPALPAYRPSATAGLGAWLHEGRAACRPDIVTEDDGEAD